jgi:hypothetical protein
MALQEASICNNTARRELTAITTTVQGEHTSRAGATRAAYHDATEPKYNSVAAQDVPPYRLHDLFLNLLAQADRINEKHSICILQRSPAKIAPLKPPKEIQSKTCPRCAMQQILDD